MKKVLSLVAAAAILAAATAFAAPVSIVNSKHNLSVSGPNSLYNGVTTQICVYCHTPHNAYTAAPLWNRNASANAPSTYTLYSGLNMANISNKSGFTSDSVSLFCMSCHDGSNLGGLVKNNPSDVATGTNINDHAIQQNLPTNLRGTSGDMRSTHPVNFEVKVGSETIQSDLVTVTTGKIGALPLFKSSRSATNTLECSSCHAVHDNQNAPFLRVTMNGSQLCLACHAK